MQYDLFWIGIYFMVTLKYTLMVMCGVTTSMPLQCGILLFLYIFWLGPTLPPFSIWNKIYLSWHWKIPSLFCVGRASLLVLSLPVMKLYNSFTFLWVGPTFQLCLYGIYLMWLVGWLVPHRLVLL